jgi:hypothetical protein
MNPLHILKPYYVTVCFTGVFHLHLDLPGVHFLSIFCCITYAAEETSRNELKTEELTRGKYETQLLERILE